MQRFVAKPREQLVRVLDADPELGRHLPEREFARARRVLLAPSVQLPVGRWSPSSEAANETDLGLLVVEGALVRRVDVDGKSSSELVGSGDVLRPWQERGELFLTSTPSWRVLAPSRVAVLDTDFQSIANRLPGVMTELVARAVERSRAAVLALALAREPSLERRLLALMWHLAGVWGRQTPDGTLIPISLGHETLGELMSASRTRTCTALGRLTERGLVARRSDRSLLLVGDSPFTTGDATLPSDPRRAAPQSLSGRRPPTAHAGERSA